MLHSVIFKSVWQWLCVGKNGWQVDYLRCAVVFALCRCVAGHMDFLLYKHSMEWLAKDQSSKAWVWEKISKDRLHKVDTPLFINRISNEFSIMGSYLCETYHSGCVLITLTFP